MRSHWLAGSNSAVCVGPGCKDKLRNELVLLLKLPHFFGLSAIAEEGPIVMCPISFYSQIIILHIIIELFVYKFNDILMDYKFSQVLEVNNRHFDQNTVAF